MKQTESTTTWRRTFRRRSLPGDGEAGMATAEYAIGTLGAAGLAGLLMALLKGGPVKDMLMNLIQQALSIG